MCCVIAIICELIHSIRSPYHSELEGNSIVKILKINIRQLSHLGPGTRHSA